MDKSFGLKLSVPKRLPLGYIHTNNELKTQSHWTVKHRYVLKCMLKLSLFNCRNNLEFTSFNVHHGMMQIPLMVTWK